MPLCCRVFRLEAANDLSCSQKDAQHPCHGVSAAHDGTVRPSSFAGPMLKGELCLLAQGAASFIRCVPGVCCWLLSQRAGMHPEASDTQDASRATSLPDSESWQC